MRTGWLKLCVLLVLVHCTGTDTGNPVAPEGVYLVRSPLARESAPRVSDESLQQLGEGNRDFAFALYREVAKGGDDNLFLSPYSLSQALAMLYAGARGETAEQMKSALHFTLPDEQLHASFNAVDSALAGRADELAQPTNEGQDPPERGDGLRLSITNAVFAPRGSDYDRAYLDLLARNYGAGVFTLDFGSASAERRINDWFAERTDRRVSQVLPAGVLDASTRLVLANALYFKAKWRDVFELEDTRPGTFHAARGDVTVPMMHGDHGLYARGEGYQMLALEYASAAVSMLFVLPDEGQFRAVEQRLDRALVDTARSGLRRPERLVTTVPRFRFQANLDATAALSALGMSNAFAANADYSGIASGLRMNSVLQQASIAIDEEGTEAAAGTEIVHFGADPSDEIYMTLDRPFLFLVYDAPTGQVLFLGRVTDPSR